MSTGRDKYLRLVEDRPPSVPPPDPLIGRTLDGRYRVEGVLGEGGMGLVYRARHAVLNKPLAIKVLRPDVLQDEELVARFQQEAKSASAIGNEHIIDIIDFGALPDGSTYFVMEFLEGLSLATAIEQQAPMAPDRVVRIARQICEALGAAHERSIVHRDLKPDNIYLIKRSGDHDFVKVLDFGIAKVGGTSAKLTRVGQVFGTPHYMSPEQCAGASVDHRTDIYALGVILYEMTCGRVPFDADNLMGILTKHMYQAPIAPRDLPQPVDVPSGLEAVILKCLSKDLDTRYGSMAAVRDDLGQLDASGTVRTAGAATLAAATTIRMDAFDRPAGLRPSRAPLAIGVVALILVVAITAGAMLAAEGGGSTVATTAPVAPAARARPATIPDPPDSREPRGSELASSVPVLDTLHLATEPEGAEVWSDGEFLGTAPLDLPRPGDGEQIEISLRHVGFRTRNVSVSARTARIVRISLVEERQAGSGPLGHHRRSTSHGAPPPPPPETTSGGESEVLDPWQQRR